MTPSELINIKMAIRHCMDRRPDKAAQVLERMLLDSKEFQQNYILNADGSFFISGNKRSSWRTPAGFKVMIRNNIVDKYRNGVMMAGKGCTVVTSDGREMKLEKYLIDEGMITEPFTYTECRWEFPEEKEWRNRGRRIYTKYKYENGEYALVNHTDGNGNIIEDV